MSSHKPHILIVGAGPTGLFLAQALKHFGVEFTISERDASIARRGRGANWGIGIYWSHFSNGSSPQIFSRLIEATADPTLDPADENNRRVPMHHGETGDWPHDIKLNLAAEAIEK
ncbi:hypothetical protein BDV98DRAFT_606640 [Pterulicium gracile]|uniref:FAD-binding domain-containing protein n=1 Tax=Pterulicium gracile TaxID=1884261 RepID=A0A5C3QC20_9AGAR|nr:hypothetical protein BDV98DRAFT_606640 [Pterula gracilis]